MSLLRRIEKSLDHRLRSLFAGNRHGDGETREAIELYRDTLEQISGRAQTGRRGEKIFPFNLVTVELHADSPERKATLEVLFEAKQLSEDVYATLREDRTEIPFPLSFNIHFQPDAAVEIRITCEKTEATATPAAPERIAGPGSSGNGPARLVTVSGKSSQFEFVLDKARINIGRDPEVQDNLGRLIRRNELHFPMDVHPANESVSRAHAHLVFDPGAGEWRIFDDGSSLGTSLFRDGNRIEVPPHGARGVLLRPGDEIYLGQVQLRFESN